MENCMAGVNLHKEQLLLLKFIYSLCHYMQCPLFFLLPGKNGLETTGVSWG
jgi:hypothetical protein